jgi:hypothetical protein
MQKCPFLDKACIGKLCQLWIEAENDCAIPQIVYALNFIKDDHLQVISRKFKEQK